MGIFFILVLLLTAALAIYMFKGDSKKPVNEEDDDYIN